jgi:hypothetical protein
VVEEEAGVMSEMARQVEGGARGGRGGAAPACDRGGGS